MNGPLPLSAWRQSHGTLSPWHGHPGRFRWSCIWQGLLNMQNYMSNWTRGDILSRGLEFVGTPLTCTSWPARWLQEVLGLRPIRPSWPKSQNENPVAGPEHSKRGDNRAVWLAVIDHRGASYKKKKNVIFWHAVRAVSRSKEDDNEFSSPPLNKVTDWQYKSGNRE